MFELSLNENEINFKSLETKIYKFVCNEACELMAQILTNIDNMILGKKIKKNTDARVQNIQTLKL